MEAHRRTTGFVLAILAGSLSIPIVLWLVDGRLGEEIGLTEPVGRPLLSWALVALITVGYSAYTLRVPLVRRCALERSGLKLIAVWAAVVSGVLEEVLFRRILMDWLLSLGAPSIVQVVGSALLFGTAHAAWILLRGESEIVWPVVASTTVLGAALAVLYLVAGRNVLPSIVAHTLINLVIEPGLILAAVSGRWQEQDPTRQPL